MRKEKVSTKAHTHSLHYLERKLGSIAIVCSSAVEKKLLSSIVSVILYTIGMQERSCRKEKGKMLCPSLSKKLASLWDNTTCKRWRWQWCTMVDMKLGEKGKGTEHLFTLVFLVFYVLWPFCKIEDKELSLYGLYFMPVYFMRFVLYM